MILSHVILLRMRNVLEEIYVKYIFSVDQPRDLVAKASDY
jgi:hypothetical protein